MSLNGHPSHAAIVATFPMPVGRRFEWHHHDDHQLAWSPEGVLVVRTDGGSHVLPPARALWIPAGIRHETTASGAAVLRTVYVRPDGCPIDWDLPTPVGVSPLLQELITHLEDRSLPDGKRLRAEAVLFDLLAPVAVTTIDVGASSRTLARAFLAETGLSFGRWRTLARLQAALLQLADGMPVGLVAARVGYRTPSAFIAAFRDQTGVSPGRYFQTTSSVG
jgi:AraC-like DNA-binding protein/quercetin dioxygenase-like cupin family protein